jgi:hypothetical protein
MNKGRRIMNAAELVSREAPLQRIANAALTQPVREIVNRFLSGTIRKLNIAVKTAFRTDRIEAHFVHDDAALKATGPMRRTPCQPESRPSSR